MHGDGGDERGHGTTRLPIPPNRRRTAWFLSQKHGGRQEIGVRRHWFPQHLSP